MASLPQDPTDGQYFTRRPSFTALWVIVTVLWTLAATLRIERVWVPILGWPVVLSTVYTWISLLLPLWLFAVILLAIKRIASGHHRPDG
jgi:hypothetical protein